jgi:hypothetical protein
MVTEKSGAARRKSFLGNLLSQQPAAEDMEPEDSVPDEAIDEEPDVEETAETETKVGTEATAGKVSVEVKEAIKKKTVSKNELNKILIEIGDMKWPGLNKHNLINAVVSEQIADKNFFNQKTWSNKEQINYAKRIWNHLDKARSCRPLFLKSPNDVFMKLASDPRMTVILQKALKMHSNGGGEGKGKEAYEEICDKYTRAKAKQAALSEWTPDMTPGEIKLIEKFEAKAKENEGKEFESHMPNENAVTYVFILGRALYESKMKCDKECPDKMLDLLTFFAVHGTKTMASLLSVKGKWEKIVGKSGKDIHKEVTNLIESNAFVTASTAGESNKLLPNFELSLKRIIRICSIVTPSNTVWGLLHKVDDSDFIDSLAELFKREEYIEAPDMTSLAIVWYLCIGRGFLTAVMVDHYEESAGNVLRDLLGSDAKEAIDPPNHVFPFGKDVTKRFA